MKMNNRRFLFSELDFTFLTNLARASNEWMEEEQIPTPQNPFEWKAFMDQYKSYRGKWEVWEDQGRPVGITFVVPAAPSNGKPWLGILLVEEGKRKKGFGHQIVQDLSQIYQDDRLLFAACPPTKNNWLLFLGKCGFEQCGYQKDEKEKEYLILAKMTS